MFLSFIIPLYNAERFISDALNSIYNISLDERDFEVVVIDDGSKDDGAEVVKTYARTHRNLRLIQQPNSGASAARNMGIEAAQGEYIWFVDADDRIEYRRGPVLDMGRCVPVSEADPCADGR